VVVELKRILLHPILFVKRGEDHGFTGKIHPNVEAASGGGVLAPK
jgi:hypothetical protein